MIPPRDKKAPRTREPSYRGSFLGAVRLTGRAIILFLVALRPNPARGQSNNVVPAEDTQVWMDVQARHALRPEADLVLSGGLRLGRDVQHFVYERAGAGFAFKLNRYVTLSPYYGYFATQPGAGVDMREHRLTLDAAVAIPFRHWTATERNIFDRRFRDPKDSSRYRNRLQAERLVRLGRIPLTLFAWDEVVYDWSLNAWVRNRLAVGGDKHLRENVSLDLYYLRQNGSHIRPANMHVMGFTLKTRF